MNKTLTILWGLIIVGSIFIAIHLFKPPSGQYIPPQEKSDIVVIQDIPLKSPDEEKTYSQLLKEGDKNINEGYISKAIQNYQQAVQINPNSIEPLLRLGYAYLKNNQAQEAKEIFEKAIKLNPNAIEAKLSLAQANFGLRDIEEAKNIIWSLDAENPQVKYYRGIIFILAKQFKEAETIFQELNDESSKKFLDAFTTFSYFKEAEPIFLNMLLAKALVDVKEFEAAIPFLFDILNEKNNYRDAWIVLGYGYLNTGRIPDAIDALQQAKALNPDEPQTLFYLGLAYFAHNDIDNAINYLEAAEQAGYEPQDQLKLKLGDLYLLKEEYQKSAANYRELLISNSENLEIFVRNIWINIDKLNQPEEALKLALHALEKHPEEAMSYNLVGWAYTATGDYGAGEKYLQTALSMNKEFDAANLNFGWLYEKKGMIEKAKTYYKKAYLIGNGNSIGNLAAIRFNKLTADITSPQSP